MPKCYIPQMYKVIKILAGLNMVVQAALMYWTATDYFNLFFMTLSMLLLWMPRKWWPLYLLPTLLMLIGLILGTYLIYTRFTVSLP